MVVAFAKELHMPRGDKSKYTDQQELRSHRRNPIRRRVSDDRRDWPMGLKDPPDSATRFLPSSLSLSTLARAAANCTACPLHRFGTQTVFGEGPKRAAIMLIGEQPGDREDIEGRPFVGPAGQLLDRALAAAGLPRDRAYVTNAVKHFKWVPRGKRRLHSSPNAMEIRACNPWLKAEIAVVKPQLLVCLGATAAAAVIGAKFRVMRDRGTVVASPLGRALGTVHPSMILRLDEDDRKREYARFVDDLRAAHAAIDDARGAA
jgi:DNA polymerase